MSTTVRQVPDPEVPAKPRSRTYTAGYKARILAEYESLGKAGKGALLRREGLYSSLLSAWQKHSYATWLVSDGVPINDVARIMGHEQTSTTLNLYTHSTAERDRRVLRSFDAYSLPPADDDGTEDAEDPSEEGP